MKKLRLIFKLYGGITEIKQLCYMFHRAFIMSFILQLQLTQLTHLISVEINFACFNIKFTSECVLKDEEQHHYEEFSLVNLPNDTPFVTKRLNYLPNFLEDLVVLCGTVPAIKGTQ